MAAAVAATWAETRAGRPTAGRAVSGSLAGPRDLAAFLARAFAGSRRHTRADSAMWSFSAKGAIRQKVFASARYRSWELTSSGSRLFSMTGRVVSQVSTPGGSTYSHTKSWLNGNPIATRKTTYGTVIPANTAIQVIGNGAGNRKS